MTQEKLDSLNRVTTILNMAKQGGSYSGIAEILGVSPSYVSLICRKQGLNRNRKRLIQEYQIGTIERMALFHGMNIETTLKRINLLYPQANGKFYHSIEELPENIAQGFINYLLSIDEKN